MPLILVVGKKERFYIALRHRGEFRKAIPSGMSIVITSRNPGVAVISQDVEAVQDPTEGAPPTVASAMIEGVKTCHADTTITALFKLSSGQADAIAQDTVKVIKTGERSGVLFGSNGFIEAVNPPAEPLKEGEQEPAPIEQPPVVVETGAGDPFAGLTAKQRRLRRRRGNQIDIVTEEVAPGETPITEAEPVVEAVQDKYPDARPLQWPDHEGPAE